MVTFAVENVNVDGESMYPNFNTGDYVIASKLDYHFHAPERGDVVIVHDPAVDPRNLIKRVIGVPGDRLLIRDGTVYINGRALREPYINPEPWVQAADYPGPQEPDGVVLAPGRFFVMGDNRNHSTDSRAFGTVSRSSITAKAYLRIWPIDQFGLVNGQHPTLELILDGFWVQPAA